MAEQFDQRALATNEAEKLLNLDQAFKKPAQDQIGALIQLQDELSKVNQLQKEHPGLSHDVMEKVKALEPQGEVPSFSEEQNGDLVIPSTPYRKTPNPLSDPVTMSIDTERALLNGGNDSLYARVARLPENGTQDPDSPNTNLTKADFQRYYAKLIAKGEHLSPEEQQDRDILSTLLSKYDPIAMHIGAGSNGQYHISKETMGVNLARDSANALLTDNLIDKIATEKSPFILPEDAELTGSDILAYLDRHPKTPQADVLRKLANRIMPNNDNGSEPRDWIAALIGFDKGKTTVVTKDSIQYGIGAFGLK
jgi:hypothetical protein